MARMTIIGLKEYAAELDRLRNGAPEVAKKVVYAGANVLADEVRKNLQKNLEGSEYSEGDLLDSLGVAPIGVDDRGCTNTKIGFDGYDRNGTPNALKARAMESGTSTGQEKKPFVRPAVNAVKKRAQAEMGRVADEEIAKIYAL